MRPMYASSQLPAELLLDEATMPAIASIDPAESNINQRVAPWAGLIRERLQRQLGTSEDADMAIRLTTQHLDQSTYASYGSKWMQFVYYCTQHDPPLSYLPATIGTCVLFAASLARRLNKHGLPAIKPETSQPYFSAINKVHTDVLGWEQGPAQGPLLAALRSGWQHYRSAEYPGSVVDQRIALPAEVALCALDVAHDALLGGSSSSLIDIRADVFTFFGFLLMGRADTDANLALDDVAVDADFITVRLRREKGRRHNATRRVMRFPVAKLPKIAAALQAWIALQRKANVAPPSSDGSFWRLKTDPPRFSPSAEVGTRWLLTSCRRHGFAPPPGFAWSSHSLRKGAASAASALLVPLGTICYVGGWSIKSRVVHDYIDPTVAPSPAGRVFFGWCLPGDSTSPP